ncbi:unnamed protein product [Effrenium voratum]|nr:unnamed protein product [Effrenium voratum]
MQSHQQRVAVNAEGRFLAHWDEFVEHRREVQAKLEEAFEMASERREAGLRLARLCQQLDTKVERLARQAKEQSTHGEAFEERVSSQAKGVEACKEAVEVLRDKIQRQVQDLSSAIATSRSELSEDAERRHHGLQEAMRRGDRCLAEEFFRKLQESSEKLSSNLQVLEDALATFVRQTRVQLADLTDQVEAKSKEQLATLKAQATESSKLEAQLAATQEETAALASRADSTEGACGEQVRQLASLESRFAKMQEAFVRFEGKASAAEDAEQSRCHQLMEHLREAKEQTASAMVRLRSELTEAISVAMSSAREESREALQGLRAVESSVAADVQALREELRQSFTSAAERQQLLVSELRGELADSSEQSRSNGRELLALIEELQGQCMELRSEGRRAAEDVAARYRAETQVHLEDLKAQLGAVRVDFAEERKQSKASRDELTVLEESCGSLRRSLLEVSSSAGKAQGSADEAASECARLQSFVEARYIFESLNPILEEMVAECIHKMPKDPVPFILDWLEKKKAAEEDKQLTPEEKERLTKENDELVLKVNKLKGQVQEAAKMASEAAVAEQEEEEEDDEDDEPPPGWERDMDNRARTSVSAEAYGEWNAKKAFVPPVIPKTDDQKDRLKMCLTKSFLFAELEANDLNIVIGAMKEVQAKENERIINQGDNGDFLFVIESGTLDCLIKLPDSSEEKCVKKCETGDVFGELALLYNCPRAASVEAKEGCVLWQLDRDTFNHIVKEAAEKKRQRYDNFLAKVPLLSSMDAYERSQLADAVKVEHFQEGDKIIIEGEPGDKFYIIEDGSAIATKGGTEVMKYTAGDYFGELALINNKPRAATVTAKGEARLLSIDSRSFKRLINVNELMAKSSKYE